MRANGKIHTFTGMGRYVVSTPLQQAIQAAMLLEMPLLLKGEPGTGKTVLAEVVATELGVPLFHTTVRSTTKAQAFRYEVDYIGRMRLLEEAKVRQLTAPDEVPALLARLNDMGNFVVPGVLWQAFDCDQRAVVLIDEIDKADLEFPNDLLHELDRMEVQVPELGRTVTAKYRPIVVITSNNEKELPPAFLRRCTFIYIPFPDAEQMKMIIDTHFPNAAPQIVAKAIQIFYQLRQLEFSKKPSTAELLGWLALLLSDSLGGDGAITRVSNLSEIPFAGVLLKDERDHDMLRQGGRRAHR